MDSLTPDQTLAPGAALDSPNGHVAFRFQADGNFVLYVDGTPVWASGTQGQTPAGLTMQGDGNLVAYNVEGQPYWDSVHSRPHEPAPGGHLTVQDDGNAVLYTADGVPIWATDTSGAVSTPGTPEPPPPSGGEDPRDTPGRPGDATILILSDQWGRPVATAGVQQNNGDSRDTDGGGFMHMPSQGPRIFTVTKPGYEAAAFALGQGTFYRTFRKEAPAVQWLSVHPRKRFFQQEDGSLYEWRETTAFGLAGKARSEGHDSIRPFVRRLRELGFNQFHVLTTLDGSPGDYWYPCRIGPNHPNSWEALDATVDICAHEGAHTRLVALGGLDNVGGHWVNERREDEYHIPDIQRRANDWWAALVDRYASHPGVILLGANEPDQIGFRDTFDQLLAQAIRMKRRAPRLLQAAGGHTREGETAFLTAELDYNDVHLQRIEFHTAQGREFWPTIKRSGENANVDQSIAPFVFGEPPNYGEGPEYYGRGGRGDVDKSPASAFALAACARSRQYNVSFHWDGGLFADEPGPLTVECMQAFIRGLTAFPMTVGGTKWRGNHQESYFEPRGLYPEETSPGAHDGDDERVVLAHVDGHHGPWRVFGVDQYAMTILEPAGFSMPAKAKSGVRVRTVDRVEYGNHAAGVYVRE